ncbi:MAG: heme exporter protein CcmB [Fimbriimonadaceae bacterium]
MREVAAVFRKEARGEFRGRSGLVTAGLFGLVAVVAVSFGTSGQRLEPTVAAGLLWVTLMFAAVIALPRALTLEEEQGTGDLLRILARPSSVYWAAVAGAVTLCGALVAHAQHRTILAGAVSLPLLLPLVAIAVGATRVAFGAGLWTQGWMAAAGLGCYALATLAIGPLLFAAVWRQ